MSDIDIFWMDSRKHIIQTIWGAALLLAGIGVFVRIPQVMPKIEQIEQFSAAASLIRFCFYFMGIILAGGGAMKIYRNYQHLRVRTPQGE